MSLTNTTLLRSTHRRRPRYIMSLSTSTTTTYDLTKYSRAYSQTPSTQSDQGELQWQHFVNPIIRLTMETRKSLDGHLESYRLKIVWTFSAGLDAMDVDQREVGFVCSVPSASIGLQTDALLAHIGRPGPGRVLLPALSSNTARHAAQGCLPGGRSRHPLSAPSHCAARHNTGRLYAP